MSFQRVGLDEHQARAVEHAGGPMLVLAGPGTGKTRVITHRIAHLIRERGVAPRSIVAVTFTVRAAESLRRRVADLVSPTAAESIFAGTFHSFARTIVRRFPDRLGFDRPPVIMDSAMRKRLLRDVVASRAKQDPAGAAAGAEWIDHLRKVIAQFHHYAMTPEQLHAIASERAAQIDRGVWADASGAEVPLDAVGIEARRESLDRFVRCVAAFEQAEAQRRERGWIGFDELLTEPIQLLRRDQRAAAVCRDEYRHLVVDEYQDTNHAQAELLALLSPPEANADLVVVGDDDQSIYEFRGADDLAFDRFAQRWHGCAQVRLERNYRSAPPVIRAANATILRANHRFAPDKVIRPGTDDADPGARTEMVRLENYQNDAHVIAQLIRADREAAGEVRAWNSYAVIVRSHTDAQRVAAGLELAAIPYFGRRPEGVAGDAGVRRLLSWMELLTDPAASWAVRGLLGVSPIGASPEARARWELDYAAQRSRSERGMPGFAAWLLARLDDEEGEDSTDDRGAIERFGAIYSELQAIAREEPAERVVKEIVRRAGLAESEMLDARDRAARVRNLLCAIGFFRWLQPRLPAPGDVASAWAYYNDLDPDEQSMGKAIGEQALDEDASEQTPSGAESDAVQLITAHSAKGLEFDTVFIPRVSPGHGYPNSRGREQLLPEGILNERLGDERDDKQRQHDEERRLFYVALTRAERRAVILTNKAKSKSKSVHFAQELAADLGIAPAGGLIELEESDILTAPVEDLDHELAEQIAANDRRAEIERLARCQAAAALERAQSAGDEAAFGEALETLKRSAATLAAQTFDRRGQSPPAWLGPVAAEARPVSDRRAAAPAPITGPLHLSYTSINGYLRCPRCWYLSRVLKLPEERSDASVVGHAVHRALEQFYKLVRTAEAGEGPMPTDADLRELAASAYLTMLPRDQVVRADVRESIIGMVHTAHTKLHDASDQILEIEHALVAPWPEAGDRCTLEIRVDRLDLLAQGHRIVDYKTGRSKLALTQPKPKDLQMALYAEVLEREMGITEGAAEYWVLRSGERGRIALADLDRQWAIEQVALMVDGLRNARFEPGDSCDACSWVDAIGGLTGLSTAAAPHGPKPDRLQRNAPPGVGQE